MDISPCPPNGGRGNPRPLGRVFFLNESKVINKNQGQIKESVKNQLKNPINQKDQNKSKEPNQKIKNLCFFCHFCPSVPFSRKVSS